MPERDMEIVTDCDSFHPVGQCSFMLREEK
jgi:hypothetical protein